MDIKKEIDDWETFSQEMLLNMTHQNIGTEDMIKFFLSVMIYLNATTTELEGVILIGMFKINLTMSGWDISWDNNYITEMREVKIYA
jgi:hypothetical protein